MLYIAFGAILAAAAAPLPTVPCNLSGDAAASIADIQLEINEALGLAPAVSDMNDDHVVNVVDIQIVIDSVLGFGCPATGPLITDFSPTSGPIGTLVNVAGANLGGATQVSVQQMGGGTLNVTPSSVSASAVAFTVPAGAGTGPIRIATPIGTATSIDSFVVTFPYPRTAFISVFSVYNQQPQIANPQTAPPNLSSSVAFTVYNQQPQITNPQTAPPMLSASVAFSIFNQQPEITNPQTAPPDISQSLTFSVDNSSGGKRSPPQPSVVDTDGGGLPDYVKQALREAGMSARPDDDPDHDGLTNLEEFCLGTDPRKADTDGDGIPDGEEVLRGTNPLSIDTDGDGYSDWEEIQVGTDPLDRNSHPSYPPALTIPSPILAPAFLRPAQWPACDRALSALNKRMAALRIQRGIAPQQKEEKQ
jgi:hypothetical protein